MHSFPSDWLRRREKGGKDGHTGEKREGKRSGRWEKGETEEARRRGQKERQRRRGKIERKRHRGKRGYRKGDTGVEKK